MLAIMKALQWVEHNKIKRDYNLHRLAVFYLISIEFMSSLGRADILYHETHYRLHEMHSNIRFIPAHKGTEGNEIVDLAKQAIRNDNIQ